MVMLQCVYILLGMAVWLTEANQEKALLVRILGNYGEVDRLSRPVADSQDELFVGMTMSLNQILSYDARTSILTVGAWLQMDWVDVKLESLMEGYPHHINLPMYYIWTPDITQYNSPHSHSDIKQQLVSVADGHAFMVLPTTLSTVCQSTDDAGVKSCCFKFGSWVYNGDLIDLREPHIDLHQFDASSSVFDIIHSNATRNAKVYDCCPEEYIDATFEFLISVPHSNPNDEL